MNFIKISSKNLFTNLHTIIIIIIFIKLINNSQTKYKRN